MFLAPETPSPCLTAVKSRLVCRRKPLALKPRTLHRLALRDRTNIGKLPTTPLFLAEERNLHVVHAGGCEQWARRVQVEGHWCNSSVIKVSKSHSGLFFVAPRIQCMPPHLGFHAAHHRHDAIASSGRWVKPCHGHCCIHLKCHEKMRVAYVPRFPPWKFARTFTGEDVIDSGGCVSVPRRHGWVLGRPRSTRWSGENWDSVSRSPNIWGLILCQRLEVVGHC